MAPKKSKTRHRRTVLRLSDLDHSKSAVLNSLGAEGKNLRVGTENGGYDLADFDWMDAWQVRKRVQLSRNELNDRPKIPQMSGEGIMVEKTEAASALVYWDGQSFRWYQLTD
jgi:hypothetical protein